MKELLKDFYLLATNKVSIAIVIFMIIVVYLTTL